MLTNHLLRLRHALAVLFMGVAVAACSTTALDGDDAAPSARQAAVSSEAIPCREGDRMVASESQCLQDDAACYQLPTGQWCTGARASACPNGSEALASGESCPSGAVCFPYSEGLQCMMKRN